LRFGEELIPRAFEKTMVESCMRKNVRS